MSETKLHYQSAGVWTGVTDVNAGDPLNAWPKDDKGQLTTFSLAGYNQSTTQYLSTDVSGGVLSLLKAGHAALILDDSVSPGSHGAWLAGIKVINGGDGGQLIDLTSPSYSYGDLTINAGSGNDILMGSSGNQTIYGKAGNDYIWGGSGTNNLYGGSGNDTIFAGGNAASDLLSGGAGNDKLVANNGADSLSGGSGNDTIVAGYGNQVLSGGSGTDTLDLSKLMGTASADPGGHSLSITVKGVTYTDKISGFETIIGTNQGDYFDGGQVRPVTLIGGTGNDHFHSESGGDLVTGGGGSNVYDWMKTFIMSAGKMDTVTDFKVGTDHLDLSDFLKGQVDPANPAHMLKAPAYAQVVHLVDNASGTMVEVLTNGTFHNAVELNGVHGAALSDLLLH